MGIPKKDHRVSEGFRVASKCQRGFDSPALLDCIRGLGSCQCLIPGQSGIDRHFKKMFGVSVSVDTPNSLKGLFLHDKCI